MSHSPEVHGIIQLGRSADAPEDTDWPALLPPPDVTRWLTVDPNRKQFVIEPGAAVPDPAACASASDNAIYVVMHGDGALPSEIWHQVAAALIDNESYGSSHSLIVRRILSKRRAQTRQTPPCSQSPSAPPPKFFSKFSRKSAAS